MNKKEIAFLKNAYKQERDAKVRERILMNIYTFEGDSSRKAAHKLQCDQKLILYWTKRYKREGLEGLKTRPRSGKPRAISRRQEANLKRKIGKHNPMKPLTTKYVRELIKEETGISYTSRQVIRILYRWNFHLSSTRPEYWQKASKEEVALFRKKN